MVPVLGVVLSDDLELVVDKLLIAIEDQESLLETKEDVCGLLLDPTLSDYAAFLNRLKQVGHLKLIF